MVACKNAKIFKSIKIERGGESIEKNMGILFLCLTFMLVGCGKEENHKKHLIHMQKHGINKNLQKCMINYQKRQKRYFKERIH